MEVSTSQKDFRGVVVSLRRLNNNIDFDNFQLALSNTVMQWGLLSTFSAYLRIEP